MSGRAEQEEQVVQQNDPWAGRALGMRCHTCMFYVPKSDTGNKIGRCRRHAPTMSGFPIVYPVDWCGDHRLIVPSAGSP